MYNFANLSHLPTAKQTNKTFFVNSNHLLTFQPNDTLFHALIFFLSLSLNRDGKLFVLLLLPNFLSLFSLFTRVFLLYQKMPELKIERDVVRICVYVFPSALFSSPGQPRCGLQVGLLSNTPTDGTMNQKDLQRRVMLPNGTGKKSLHLRELNLEPHANVDFWFSEQPSQIGCVAQ